MIGFVTEEMFSGDTGICAKTSVQVREFSPVVQNLPMPGVQVSQIPGLWKDCLFSLKKSSSAQKEVFSIG